MSANLKAKGDGWVRLAGVFGILGFVLPTIMVVFATVLSPWFRWNTNALSDLGVGSEASLFNSGVFLGGVFSFLFGLGLWRYLHRIRRVAIGILLFLLGSICLALVGIFTVSYLPLHAVVALSYFILVPVGILLTGMRAEDNTIRVLSRVVGVAALAAILVLPVILFGLSLKVGFAVPEEIEALIVAVWTLFMAAKLMRNH